MREEVLRMERVTYRSQGVPLLDNLSLNIFAGEVFGLVPASSFGVAALTQVLQQNLPLHYGYIYYKERLINTWRGSNGRLNRICLIQDTSSLVGSLTVADNIFVLRPGFRKYLISPKVLRQQLDPFLREVGMDIPADAYADRLTVFQRVVAELLKAMVAGCGLAILWDVSTFLSQQELAILHGILRRLSARGMSFLYICPHMEEARPLCSRTALMSGGQIVKIFPREEPVPAPAPLSGPWEELSLRRSGKTAFSAEHIPLFGTSTLSFQVAPGECLVLQDLSNRLPAPMKRKGTIAVGGKPLTRKNSRQIAVIQELPTRTMVFPQLSYLDNLCFTLDHRMPRVWLDHRIRRSLRQDYGPILGEDVFDTPIDALTEAQKYQLIYTRILLQRPQVVLCIHPFKGADMAQRKHITGLLQMLLDKEIAVIILDVSLTDSLPLAHRVIQLQEGREPRELPKESFA